MANLALTAEVAGQALTGGQSVQVNVLPGSRVLITVFLTNMGLEPVDLAYVTPYPQPINPPPGNLPEWAIVSAMPLVVGQTIQATGMWDAPSIVGRSLDIRFEGEAFDLVAPCLLPEGCLATNIFFQIIRVKLVATTGAPPGGEPLPPTEGGGFPWIVFVPLLLVIPLVLRERREE